MQRTRTFTRRAEPSGGSASAVFGTVVGSLADKFGRRNSAILYCAIYFGHCATKHWGLFNVLMLGRILGGISTSLLFSVFDSWLVSESQRQGFDGAQLGNTFSLAYLPGLTECAKRLE